MKRYCFYILVLIILVSFSACVKPSLTVESGTLPKETNPIEDEKTPSPTPTPQKVIFSAKDSFIYKKVVGNSEEIIYDASEQFPQDWKCWVTELVIEDNVFYFIEVGFLPESSDENDLTYAIIRLDQDGEKRTVLRMNIMNGLSQLISHGNRLFFIESGMDSLQLGWLNKDVSASGWVDMSEYIRQHGVEPQFGSYYIDAYLYVEDDGILYAEVDFYDEGMGTHIVSIDENLLVQKVEN